MTLTEREQALILAGLFELRITPLENAARWDAPTALAEKLGDDPTAMFFGIDLTALPEANAKRPEIWGEIPGLRSRSLSCGAQCIGVRRSALDPRNG